ncbi:MAG TPA: hypothetical protein VMF69_18945 [Gemmataceae bacterium]|nr:hypothetical protein [Gemmataceae bacterium]
MRWYLFAQTILPPVLPMLAIYALWAVVEVAPEFVVFVFLASLLPLLVQFGLWTFHQSAETRTITSRPWHPFGVILPLALLLIVPFLAVAEGAAKQVPCLCEVVAGEKVPTDKDSSFAVHVRGWGNARSFEFTGGMVIYTGQRRFEDLYFAFPEMRGHWTNSYTTFFPVTRSVVADYVRRSDDFSAEQAEKLADRLWDTINRYAERRDLPPMTDQFGGGNGPRIESYVQATTVYLVSCLFSLLVSAFISWPLVYWYARRLAR